MKKSCCPNIPFKKVTHIIFDMDGTILDCEKLNVEVLGEICKKYEKFFRPSLHNKTAGATLEDIAKLMINEYELPLTEEEFIEMFKELFTPKCADIELMPGAEQLIKHFAQHNVPMAVASSTTDELMVLKTQNYKRIFDHFHHFVCGGTDMEVRSGKPSPEIFLVCASRFDKNPDPENCLVLEDSPNGVKAALRAGMQVVMIPADDVPYEIWKTATVRLDTLEHLAPELFGLPPLVVQAPPLKKISFTMHYEALEKALASQKEDKKGEEGTTGEKKRTQDDSLSDFQWLLNKNETS